MTNHSKTETLRKLRAGDSLSTGMLKALGLPFEALLRLAHATPETKKQFYGAAIAQLQQSKGPR